MQETLAKSNQSWWILSIPLYIFFLGQIFGWVGKKRKKFQETKNYKNWILTWVKLSTINIKQQIDNLKSFSTEIEKNTVLQPIPIQFSVIVISKVIESDIQDNINAFVINSRGNKSANSNSIYDFLSNLNYIQIVIDDIHSHFNRYTEYNNDLVRQWNSKVIELNNLVNKHTAEIFSKEYKYKEYQEKILSILDNWSIKSDNIITLETQLIIPLMEQLRRISNNDLSNIYAAELRSFIQNNFNYLLSQWKHNKQENKKIMANKAKELEEALQRVAFLYEYLTLLKTKWCCK